MQVMNVAVAQLPNVVGDIQGNAERVGDAMSWAEAAAADVLVLPELVLTGYPPEDLVQHREFLAEAEEALGVLARHSGRTVTVVSTVTPVAPRRSWDSVPRTVSISAALLSGGERRGTYHKVLLPTYGGFNEGKNFAPGDRPDALWRIGDVIAGVSICEDLWSGDGPPEAQSAAGAQVILSPNASSYHRGKAAGRQRLARSVARRNGLPLIYVNLYGGHDDLVFDGGSLVVGADGAVLRKAADFVADRFVVDVPVAAPRHVHGPLITVHTRPLPRREVSGMPEPTVAAAEPVDEDAEIWQALVTGTRDFARANGYTAAVLGLSGGIDSAVTAAVAADALGADNVLGLAMPAPTSPPEDQRDAEALATNLGIGFDVVPAVPVTEAVIGVLSERVPGVGITGTAAAHLAARIRAAMLLALADERGYLLLATGNKTELSIGGAALQGDMAGAFAPLSDCPKTLLYRLARQRNREHEVVPEAILAKTPSAQRDGGAGLPPYEVLDAIVEGSVEFGLGLEDLVAEGFDAKQVLEVLRRIDAAELKRRLIPPGVKISPRAYGTDRRMPISNHWRVYRRPDTPPGTAQERTPLQPEHPETAISPTLV